jgi:dolichyl-phosphate beta-glucosyltransferase
VQYSIVIPAYNEAQRIGPTISRVGAYLSSRQGPAEIIVVDDGSSDSTAEVVQNAGGTLPATIEIVLLSHYPNKGKGAAVREGCLAARGDQVLFTDADLATPIEEADKLWDALNTGNDLAIGSRIHAGGYDMRVSQPLYRRALGWLYHRLAAALAVGDIRDTQCGFKAFTREAAGHLFAQQRVQGLVFDTELLFIARQAGFRIAEVPVAWSNVGGSRMRISAGQALHVIADLLSIRFYHRPGQSSPRKSPLPGGRGPG